MEAIFTQFIKVICIVDVLNFKQKCFKMFRLRCSRFKVPGSNCTHMLSSHQSKQYAWSRQHISSHKNFILGSGPTLELHAWEQKLEFIESKYKFVHRLRYSFILSLYSPLLQIFWTMISEYSFEFQFSYSPFFLEKCLFSKFNLCHNAEVPHIYSYNY